MASADRYRGDHLPQVGVDILELKDLQLQKIALTRIAQLVKGEIQGARLQRELSGCWKLYFDKQENDVGRRLNRTAPRYRIVYRLLDPVVDPAARDRRPRLQVVAVGPRYQSEAYERAASRLARPAVLPDSAARPTAASPDEMPRQRPAAAQRSRPEPQLPFRAPPRPHRSR